MNVQRIVHPSQSIGFAAIPTYLLTTAINDIRVWSLLQIPRNYSHTSAAADLTAEDAQDGGYCAYNKEEENETLVRLSNGYIETNSK